MGARWAALVLICAVAPACGGGGGGGAAGSSVSFIGVGMAATPVVGNGAVPAALTGNFELGIANFDLTWPNATAIPFGYRSQYLSGGVNTGTGW